MQRDRNPSSLRSGRLLPAVLPVFALIGCVNLPRFEPRPLPEAEQGLARQQMRDHAKTHCGVCHQGSLASARPRALAVFDLDRDDWPVMLSTARLTGAFPRRIYSHLDEAGRQQLRRFVESELARRGGP